MKLIDENLFEKEFIDYVVKLSKGLKLPPALVVQNIVMAKLARDKANIDVYGYSDNLLLDFPGRTGEDGETYLITGVELYNMTYQMEKERLERERIEQIQESLKYLTFGQLPDDDKELMKRRGLDPESKKRREKKKKEAEELLEKYKNDIGPVKTEWTNKKDKE